MPQDDSSSEEQGYPDEFIRGITDLAAYQNGMPTYIAFNFSSSSENPERIDDKLEESINWCDDQGAIDCIMNQKKENDEAKLHFRHGGLVFKKKPFDEIMSNPAFSSAVGYERSPIEGKNPYHGNILLSKGLSKQLKTTLVGGIVVNAFVRHEPNPNS